MPSQHAFVDAGVVWLALCVVMCLLFFGGHQWGEEVALGLVLHTRGERLLRGHIEVLRFSDIGDWCRSKELRPLEVGRSVHLSGRFATVSSLLFNLQETVTQTYLQPF